MYNIFFRIRLHLPFEYSSHEENVFPEIINLEH